MQDHFMEEVVIKQKNMVNRLLYLLSWVIIILSGLSAMFMFSSVTSTLRRGAFGAPLKDARFFWNRIHTFL